MKPRVSLPQRVSAACVLAVVAGGLIVIGLAAFGAIEPYPAMPLIGFVGGVVTVIGVLAARRRKRSEIDVDGH